VKGRMMKMFENKSDSKEMWNEFVNTCRNHGVDLDYLTHCVYEFGLDRDLSYYDFTNDERDKFIDDIWLVRMKCNLGDRE
jgi:hypothetical protein